MSITISEFKKVGRILKFAYKEAEDEAVRNGIEPFSPQFERLISLIRDKVLERLGYTLDEYREAKLLYLSNREKLLVGDAVHIPTAEEIIEKAHEVAKQYIKPPQITNQIVEKTTKIVEEPIFIENTEIVERIIEREVPVKEEAKEYTVSPNVPEINPKENIGIFDMPNFRKLAMGLQEQIDALRADTTGTSAILTATGTIDDSNKDFTFTEKPTLIVVNGALYQETGGAITWTWSGTTATLSSPVGTGGSIFGRI